MLGLLALAPGAVRGARTTVALAGLGLYVTLLLGRGYSPQFLVYQLPLLLLLWPGWRGAGYALALTVLGLLEWPIAIALVPERHDVIALVVGARTVLWALIGVEMASEVWPSALRRWSRARTGVLATASAVGRSKNAGTVC